MKCPTCRGVLVLRGNARKTLYGPPKFELVYACQGICGTQWSYFDLRLAQR